MPTLLQKFSLHLLWFWGILVFGGLYLVSLQSYLLFHSLIEIFSVVVAFSIFIIAWNTRRLHENHFFLFISIAYFFVGSLDLIHTLSYKGMELFPNHDANLPTQMWISARYLESGSLLIAPLFFRKKLAVSFVIVIYALLFNALIGAIFYRQIFPDCFVEGSGLTQFKIGSEYLICLLLLMAIVHLNSYRHNISHVTFKLLIASLVLSVLAELSFTLYFSMYGHANMVGHYFKLLSFYFIYKALVRSGLTKPTELLFRNLEEKSKLYQDLYDNAPDMFISCEARTGKVRQCNLATATNLGYTRDEIIGRHIKDLYHPDSEEKRKKVFKTFVEKGTVRDAELQLLRKDGSRMDVSLNISAVRDEQGKALYSRSIWRDISARKKAENALLETETRYRELFNNMNSGCAVYKRNHEGHYIFSDFNLAAERIEKIRKENLFGQEITKIFPTVKDFGLLDVLENVWATGIPQYLPISLYTDERISGWRDNYVYKLPSGEIVAVYDDITARKQAEEKLLLFRRLIDNSNDAIFVIEPQTGGFLDVNQKACEALQYSRAEFFHLDATDIEMKFPDDFSWQENIKQLKDHGGQHIKEGIHRRKDGTTFPVEVNASYIQLADREYLVSVVRDISERKAAEKELLRTMKELQDANAELSQFNYVVAHDLKAPIRAMSNYASFLQEDLAPVVSGETKKYLTQLRQTAVETGKMVEDLLTPAKIGNQKQEPKKIELGDFMEKLVNSMDLSPDIEIRLGSEWPTIVSDPLLLRQVFQNLIDNARKYTIASCKRIEIGCLPGEDELTVFVRDNGIGIGAAYHEQIFGLFERLHTSAEYSGTGVGLAIVKKAVGRLGGTIRLESTEGKGTTFYVILPLETA